MTALPPDEPHHNHITRAIQPRGSDCPGCESYWKWADEEAFRQENVVHPNAALTDADLAARLVTIEIPPSMAAHMDRHRVGGYSVQGGVLSSDSRPEVWPL